MKGTPTEHHSGGGAGCDLPSRQGEPGPSFICQAAPLTARTARVPGKRGWTSRPSSGLCPSCSRGREALGPNQPQGSPKGRGWGHSCWAGSSPPPLRAPPGRPAGCLSHVGPPGQSRRAGRVPAARPAGAGGGPAQQLLPEAGPTAHIFPAAPPASCKCRIPPRVGRPPPPPPLPCWDSGTGPPSTSTQFFHRGRVRRGGSLCRRSSEWGRTRPKPGREAEESRSPGRMALKLIYDPLRETARSQVGNSTFPAPRGAPCTAQRPLWPSTASPAVCGLGTGNPLPL